MMRLDENPVFRKVIVPWYDAEALCIAVIIMMFFVFLFGIAGITVARQSPDYHEHIWVPIILIVLSVFVIISTTVRLIKRYIVRFSK